MLRATTQRAAAPTALQRREVHARREIEMHVLAATPGIGEECVISAVRCSTPWHIVQDVRLRGVLLGTGLAAIYV